jgi:carbamoyl-phosphate synthase large subunit
MGVATSFGLAFSKAQLAASQRLPSTGAVFLSVNDRDKDGLLRVARKLAELGLSMVATRGTAAFLSEAGVAVDPVFKVNEGRPNVVDLIGDGKIHLIINTPLGKESFFDESAIRRAAIRHQIPCITTLEGATAAAAGIEAQQQEQIEVRSLQEMHPPFRTPEKVRRGSSFAGLGKGV